MKASNVLEVESLRDFLQELGADLMGDFRFEIVFVVVLNLFVIDLGELLATTVVGNVWDLYSTNCGSSCASSTSELKSGRLSMSSRELSIEVQAERFTSDISSSLGVVVLVDVVVVVTRIDDESINSISAIDFVGVLDTKSSSLSRQIDLSVSTSYAKLDINAREKWDFLFLFFFLFLLLFDEKKAWAIRFHEIKDNLLVKGNVLIDRRR